MSEQCGSILARGLAGLGPALCNRLPPAAFRDSRIQLLGPLSVDPRLREERGWEESGTERLPSGWYGLCVEEQPEALAKLPGLGATVVYHGSRRCVLLPCQPAPVSCASGPRYPLPPMWDTPGPTGT